MQAVILAAGRGTRMGPLCATRPKPLLPIAGKPLLWWTLTACAAAGLRDITLVVHGNEPAFRRFLKDEAPATVKVRLFRQSKPLGTGHGLLAARRAIKGPFVLIFGDVLPTVKDLSSLARGSGHIVGAAYVPNVGAFGALVIRDRRLRRILEKTGQEKKGLINAGVYRFERSVLDRLAAVEKSPRGEYELTDAINQLAAAEHVGVHRLEAWREAGRPWHLLDIQQELMSGLKRRIEGEVEPGVVLHGVVQIGKGTVVKSGTYIEGPVVIGRDCKIGPRTYLRPSTAIGNGCHIGAGVEIKNSIIMDRSNVPHLSYVGDSIVGSDCNLGAGTSTANLKLTDRTIRVTWSDGSLIDTRRRKLGAIVGDNTKVGINCSLAPGCIIGADCLVGMGRSVSGWVPQGSKLV